MKTKTDPVRVVVLAVFSALVLALPARGDLIHRYSFNETSGTTVDDSVGTADGIIKGDGASFDGAGQLYLPGGVGSATVPPAGYVDLPNHIINVWTNLTVETWVTWQGSGIWERIFDFGTSAGGEDVVNGNGNYLFLSPQGNASDLRFAVRDPATGTEPVLLMAGAPLPQGQETCVTVTYNYTANTTRLYSNGVLLVTGPAMVALSTINDVNNWLGRSQWDDAMFVGSYNEFRIYNSALSPVEVAASRLSGPNNPSTDLGSLGAVQAVHLLITPATMTAGDESQASATVDFANAAGLSLAEAPGVTYQSGDTNVLTVTAGGKVTAVGQGTANVTVSYQGSSDSVSITVNPRLVGLAIAGTLFVDLVASDVSSDPTTWPNRTAAAGDDFSAVGTPTYVANVGGTGVAGVEFIRSEADAYLGPITTADLDGGSDRSIEVWAYNPRAADDETLVAWGHRGSTRQNMAVTCGSNLGYGAAGLWADDLGWTTGMPAVGQWHHFVFTYDGATTAKVYADGFLKTTRTLGAVLDTFFDQPIRLGAQGNTAGDDFDFGQALSGYIAAVRVHTGLLSDNDVKNNFLFGIEGTLPGNLTGASLTLSDPTLYGPGTKGRSTVKATYANRNYLLVTGSSTFASSDDTVVTVDAATGVYTAVKVGSASITATYNGVQGSQTVTVVSALPTELKHRYSFNDAVGSTAVDDSVGTADGLVKGNGAVFDGTGLTLPGGTGSAADPATIAGYVDLPNGIISSLHNATFETWLTYGTASIWQRIFDFGISQGGEDVVDGYGRYLFLSPGNSGGVNLRFAVRDDVIDAEPIQLTAGAPLPTGEEVYLAVTYDQNANVSRVYSNAVVVLTGTTVVPLNTIPDVNNWLGRSQWNDNMFSGRYNEFRIWEGAFSEADVAAAYAAGPDQLPVVTPPPTITASLSGANLVLRWPATATGFGMESTVVLAPASWTAVDISGAVDDGGQKRLTVPIEGTTKFYRMKK